MFFFNVIFLFQSDELFADDVYNKLKRLNPLSLHIKTDFNKSPAVRITSLLYSSHSSKFHISDFICKIEISDLIWIFFVICKINIFVICKIKETVLCLLVIFFRYNCYHIVGIFVIQSWIVLQPFKNGPENLL